MKRFFLFVSLVCACVSCTDRDFDLTKIDTRNITIGDEYVVPLANFTIDLEDYMEELTELLREPETRAAREYVFTGVDKTFNYSAPLEEEFINNLTEKGTIDVKGKIDIGLPISLEVSVIFQSANGEAWAPWYNKVFGVSDEETTATIEDISREDLTFATKAQSVRIIISPVNEGRFFFDKEDLKAATIKLSVSKTGGIKL